MAPRRPAPLNREDAIYERIIEVQERQAAIAEEQNRTGARRDEILNKLADGMIAINNGLAVTRPAILEISERVEQLPIVEAEQRAIVVKDLKETMEKRNRALALWVFVATFLGTAAGDQFKFLVDLVRHAHP